MTLEERIGRLEDVEAIKQLMSRYALACDGNYRLEPLMALFAPDFVMEFGEPVGDYSGEAVARFWAKAPEINLQPMHYMISPIVQLASDGVNARGSIYLWEATTQLDSDGRPIPVWAAGVYDNSFRKIDGQWKISRIRLRFETLCSADLGWVKEKIRVMEL